MATDPKDKELTDKQAGDAIGGRTQESTGDEEIAEARLRKEVQAAARPPREPGGGEEIAEAELKAFAAGKTQPPKRE